MTHAAKSHDAWEEIQAMRERLAAELERAERLATKLDAERMEMESRLALANALALIRSLNTTNMSTGQRVQRKGVMDQIQKVLAA